MKCPDCQRDLRGDGSCCDFCGWAMVGGGDDPRLPSNRSREQIATETNRRTVQRAFRNLDFASSLMREVIAGISTLPDTKSNQALHRHASAIEERIRHLQSLVSEVRR